MGYDARATSKEYFKSLTMAISDSGANVLSLGMSGTEEMYWAVTQYLLVFLRLRLHIIQSILMG